MAEAITVGYEDGARAVELAREAVTGYTRRGQRTNPGSMREAFYQRTGAFVRLTTRDGRGRLRGCAGSYRTDDQLGLAIVEAAIRAAGDETGGSAVGTGELDNLQVSVYIVESVTLTDDPIADLELGHHGLAVDRAGKHGWLYPTVPVENDWNEHRFCSRVCRKAGLSPTAWEDEETVVTLIDGSVFRERHEGSVEQL